MGGRGDTLGENYHSWQTDERNEDTWEERRGTYNPDDFLMQFQACPWSSALFVAAQHSLVLGSRVMGHHECIHTDTRTPTDNHTQNTNKEQADGNKERGGVKVNKRGGRKQKGKHDWEIMEDKTIHDFLIRENHTWLQGCMTTFNHR